MWEPRTGKTVAGNAAPYRRNLQSWLEAHPGWEEKADELKSSKRRSAARRLRTAAHSFAAMCCYQVASFLAGDAAARLNAILATNPTSDEKVQWSVEDFVRLQECLCRLGQQAHKESCNVSHLDSNRWSNITFELGESKDENTVLSCAHHMLTRGITKSIIEISANRASWPTEFGSIVECPIPSSSLIGSPASPDLTGTPGQSMFDGHAFSAPIPSSGAAAVLERSFRAPREPRVTVWNPANGRTISGNAAPCRRNLDAWMRQHPGWLPKEEGQLSSSRRNRNRKVRPASVPISVKAAPVRMLPAPEISDFHDAIEGLLVLSKSPHSSFERLKMMRHECSCNESGPSDVNMAQDGDLIGLRAAGSNSVAHVINDSGSFNAGNEAGGPSGVDSDGNRIMQEASFVPTSSVSCSSLEDGVAMSDGEGADVDDADDADDVDDTDDTDDVEHSDMEM